VKMVSDQHDDLSNVIKRPVVAVVAFKLRQVKYRNFLLGKNLAVGLLIWVDVTEPRHPAPDELRHTEGLIVLRNKQCKARSIGAHSSNLCSKHIDVHVRCYQKNISYLTSNLTTADCFAAQCLKRDPISHRMSKNIDLLHIGIG